MQQLEHQQELQQQENERRQRQLEAEQFRLWLDALNSDHPIWLQWETRDCRDSASQQSAGQTGSGHRDGHENYSEHWRSNALMLA